MEYFWLNEGDRESENIKKHENKKLIVFFNGWAMNETPIKHLEKNDFDILVLFDYRKLDFDFSKFNFEKYSKKYLIAWSMGVCAVNKFKNIFQNFNKKTAINGTGNIVDNVFGIPKKIYNATIKFLNEENLDKFVKNMFDNGKINPDVTITRPLADLKEELISIQNIVFDDTITFDKVIVSKNDRIIPANNQLNFWQDKKKFFNIEKIDAAHCPFEKYKSWQELLD